MPKRPTGLFKRGKIWYVRVQINGRDHKISLKTSDFARACKEADKVKASRRFESKAKPARAHTVRELVTKWLTVRVATARVSRGQRLTRRRAERFLVPMLGPLRVDRVTPDHLRELRVWMERPERRKRGKGALAPSTVADVLKDAKCFFLWAEDAGYVDRAPIPRKLLPRLPERLPDRLTDAEVDAVLSIPEPDAFVLRLAIGSGLRRSELVHAQATDLDARGQLIVHHLTKTGKLRRVPLGEDLVREIRARVGLLVPYSASTLSNTFARRVRKLSGVQRFHLHMTRHAYACRYLEAGGTLPALQILLGHASIKMTQVYARLADDHVRAEAQRVMNGLAGTVAGTVGV